MRRQLSAYGGTYRRFQLVGTVDGVRVFDDYAHHPTEVRNTLIAARTGGRGRPGRGLLPAAPLHPYPRLLAPSWLRRLELADEAIVMDVCGDREDPIAGIDGAMVADAVRPGTAQSPTSRTGTTRPRPWPGSPGPVIW